MTIFNLRNIVPRFLANPLWGNRGRWGLRVNEGDHDWLEWQRIYTKFYNSNQREGVGVSVNDAGYQIMATVDLADKIVLEVGAGDIRHLRYWSRNPKEYLLADISEDMMQYANECLLASGIPSKKLMLLRNQTLPVPDESIDAIISFYSLEHLYPLEPYLEEMRRVLKPGGTLVGAIPAEGGMAWGLGRFFTSRRWFKRNTKIDPDKIICWEHPNYADEIILALDKYFERQIVRYWPFRWLPWLDANLVLQFSYIKAK